MAISKQQPMRPALEDVIDAVNDIGDIEPYITDAVEDWLDEHPEATTTVQDDSLTTAKYQDGSVTGAKIATNAITTAKVATGAVTAEKIANGAVGRDKLAGDAISGNNEPGFTAGSSRALLGDAETVSWMERTTAADGAALVDAIYGNTIVQDGSLLPVRMEGIETVGFNQWDEQWEVGDISSTTGQNTVNSAVWRSKNYIPVFPGATYYATGTKVAGTDGNMRGRFYDAEKNYIGDGDANNQSLRLNRTFTVPAGACYMRFCPQNSQIVDKQVCINISDPARNGTYEPHWSYQLAIPVSTYFPDGMRSAGSVRDELRADAAVTRVGVVDLGTLDWTYASTSESGVVRMRSNSVFANAAKPSANNVNANITCAKYATTNASATYAKTAGIDIDSTGYIHVYDPNYNTSASVDSFAAAMSGVMLYYELATPTTTPVDPPLPMSYRTGAGGTERIMVASGTQSAPPVFATRYPLDPTDLAASIAPRESTIATGNHAIGDLIMLGWTLCKATQVIVTGETIEIGTNVTKTSVAAELAALS